MSQSDDNQILYSVRIDIPPEIRQYVIQLPVFSTKYPPAPARERARKSLPGAGLPAGAGVRSAH
jgi:hypothetical protein